MNWGILPLYRMLMNVAIGLVYVVLSLGIRYEAILSPKQTLIQSSAIQIEGDLSVPKRSDSHLQRRHCVHHPIACPPDCHCPPLENDDVDVRPGEALVLSTDVVLSPCASQPSAGLGMSWISFHLPNATTFEISDFLLVPGFSNPSPLRPQDVFARIEKVPIVA